MRKKKKNKKQAMMGDALLREAPDLDGPVVAPRNNLIFTKSETADRGLMTNKSRRTATFLL